MLKRLLVVSVLGLLCTTRAFAETLFRGALFTTKADNCPNGPNEGDFSNAQFHPSALPGNNDFSALNKIFSFSALTYHLLTGSFTPAFQKVNTVGIGWTDYKPEKPSSVLVSKQTPPSLDANTKSVTLIGKIKNPFGEVGQDSCIESFLFVGGKIVQ
jgi:hypothetical protein